ncbi:MAG: 2-hydroxychromene-2-carboxylate isomerase [Myxococcota bacterium]
MSPEPSAAISAMGGGTDSGTDAAAIDFVYDVVCPYAYLASLRIGSIAERLDVTVRWRPVLLGGLFREIGADVDPNLTMPPARAAMQRRDRARCAELRGAALRSDVDRPGRTVRAMRLCTAARGAARPAVSRALFDAHWVSGRDVADPRVVDEIAADHGIDAAVLERPETKQALRATTSWAATRGVFGVPTFVTGGRTWWGADRIELMVAALGGEGAVDRDPGGRDPGGQMPSARRSALRIECFHDFASPFSYLAVAALEAVTQRYGVSVQWRPTLVGALFKAIGTADVPLLTMPKAKQAYVRQDLADWARVRGVPFRFPTHFPLRSVLPLRVALQQPAVTPALYRAAWVDDRRIDGPDTLGPVLAAAGFDAQALLRGAGEPRIKDALRANTERARSLHACGVPTIVVYDETRPEPLVLWGQDRLGTVDAVCRGFWPTAG